MNRDISLDIASGFCLLIVILGHIICFCDTPVNLFVIVDVFCFYLAFFFFKAGVCFKIRDRKNVVNNGFKRLIIPFIVYSLLSLFLVVVFKWVTIDWMNLKLSVIINAQEFLRDIYKMGAPQCNLALWFLPSLYVCRIISNCLLKYISNYAIVAIVVAIPLVCEIVKIYGGGERRVFAFLFKEYTYRSVNNAYGIFA